MLEDRARGALLGQAVGDALGTTHEGMALVAPPFPQLARGPLTDIAGGGLFDLAPGQTTDDTQLAVCLAESLLACGGFNALDAMRRYRVWLETPPFDVGGLTSASLRVWCEGCEPAASARSVWEGSGRRAASNGSLMRTTPIGVWHCGDDAARRAASLADSSSTHFDPRCQLACASLNAAIAAGLRGGDPAGNWTAAREEIGLAAADLRSALPDLTDVVDAAERALRGDLDAAARDDPVLYEGDVHLHHAQWFVRTAFRLAFWELRHAPSYAAALIDVVNRGGDTDTNGAVAGALLGATYGEAAIPETWRQAVLRALQDGPPSPWRDAYHPRQFLAFAEAAGRRR